MIKVEWTTTERYRPYKEWPDSYIKKLKEQVAQSNWRLNYHIQPETGLLNDPNGFSFFNGKWHLFYQHFPFGPTHGLKSWFHLSSIDLIHWESEKTSIEPEMSYESHGVYSGSAIPVDEKLFLAYTGNVRDDSWERHSYQLGAWLTKEGDLERIELPLINQPPNGFTMHFRDPQILQYKDRYLMVIGGQTDDQKGKVLFFESYDLKQWENLGPLEINQDLGFMVECPNLLFIENKTVLLLCPQGLDKKTVDYQNVYPNTYILADNYSKEDHLLQHSEQQQLLDEGFDLYAAQAFCAPDGRCLSVGWIGLPEMEYPTFQEGWAHSLSLIKELTINEGKLYQYPVEETKLLRQSQENLVVSAKETLVIQTENSYELQFKIPNQSKGEIALFSDELGEKALILDYDTENGAVSLDRSSTDYPLNSDYGYTRKVEITKGQSVEFTIFIDQSTCEIFINQGEKTMTTTYYPNENQNYLVIESDQEVKGTYYRLAK